MKDEIITHCEHSTIKHFQNLNGDVIYSSCEKCSQPWPFEKEEYVDRNPKNEKILPDPTPIYFWGE